MNTSIPPTNETDMDVALRYRDTVRSLIEHPKEQHNEELQKVAALALESANNALDLFERSAKFTNPTARAYAYRQEGIDQLDTCSKHLNEALACRWSE